VQKNEIIFFDSTIFFLGLQPSPPAGGSEAAPFKKHCLRQIYFLKIYKTYGK